jgi:hypothetical protein
VSLSPKEKLDRFKAVDPKMVWTQFHLEIMQAMHSATGKGPQSGVVKPPAARRVVLDHA